MVFTANEIRTQQFKKIIRGYDPREVDIFLNLVADEFERLTVTIHKLENEIERLKEELEDYKTKERHIRNSLVAVQKTRDQILEEARREAQFILANAEHQKDNMLTRIETLFQELVHDLEQAKLERERVLRMIQAEAQALLQWCQQRQEKALPEMNVRMFKKNIQGKGTS